MSINPKNENMKSFKDLTTSPTTIDGDDFTPLEEQSGCLGVTSSRDSITKSNSIFSPLGLSKYYYASAFKPF